MIRQPEGPLPTSRDEMDALGWSELDVLIVTGNAYVDHPAFGEALLGRWLVEHGFRTGIVPQPRWDTPDDLAVMGRPRLFVGVTAGSLDSMLAAYTAFRKKRRDDAYTPGGRAGARPNRASIVYANLARRAFPSIPVVLGGIEASLRRVVHYDFWTDALRRPIVLDAKADAVAYGMAERTVVEVARRIEAGQDLIGMLGVVVPVRKGQDVPAGVEPRELPSLEEIRADPRLLMDATLAMERQVHHGTPWLVQRVEGEAVLVAPPAEPLSTGELDRLYALPFTREAHPRHSEAVPALEMIRHSVTSHRGCGGGCGFCSLALHQGRRVQSRSRTSILGEVRRLVTLEGWTGSVTDVGGPTANMWGARCAHLSTRNACDRSSCHHPRICRHFEVDQGAIVGLLRAVALVPGVRHVRVASGVRHDLALESPEYLVALVGEFTGGQLKVAPEHLCDRVLRLARKPGRRRFEELVTAFERLSREAGKEQYVVPYFLSALPGCTDADMEALAGWLRRRGWSPRQVQCFVPTPGTVATAMFFAGVDTRGRPIPVARTDAERLHQHRTLTGGPGGRADRHG